MATSGPSRSRPSPQLNLISGACSGLASCVLLQPIDLLKTRLQQEERHGPEERGVKGKERGGLAEKGLDIKTASTKKGRIWRTAKAVIQTDGVLGLWRGTVPTVWRNVPGVALYFFTIQDLRGRLASAQVPVLSVVTSPPGMSSSADRVSRPALSSTATTSHMAKLSSTGNLLTGAVARVWVGFLLSPITIVKARFESSTHRRDLYPTISSTLRHIYTTQGVRGLFKGFGPTAIRDAPYAGIYLAIYEGCKEGLGRVAFGGRHSGGRLTTGKSKDDVGLLGTGMVHSSSGMIAATLATLVTHPADILKTRMQIDPDRYRTVGQSIARVLKTSGALSFFDGIFLRAARKALSSAIGWTMFESILLWRMGQQRLQAA